MSKAEQVRVANKQMHDFKVWSRITLWVAGLSWPKYLTIEPEACFVRHIMNITLLIGRVTQDPTCVFDPDRTLPAVQLDAQTPSCG